MGGGSYCTTTRAARMKSSGMAQKSRQQVFTQRRIHPEMDPANMSVRESRDSAEHPESLAIIIALDVTGSMGEVPEAFVRTELPKIVSRIIAAGVKDPQILLLGIGDHIFHPVEYGYGV